MKIKMLIGLVLLCLGAFSVVKLYPHYASTYGKWEDLTRKHGAEFEPVFDSARGICLFTEHSFIKVIARVFMQQKGGGSIIAEFRRGTDGKWHILYDGYCNYRTYNSVSNGSPRGYFLWYFFLGGY